MAENTETKITVENAASATIEQVVEKALEKPEDTKATPVPAAPKAEAQKTQETSAPTPEVAPPVKDEDADRAFVRKMRIVAEYESLRSGDSDQLLTKEDEPDVIAALGELRKELGSTSVPMKLAFERVKAAKLSKLLRERKQTEATSESRTQAGALAGVSPSVGSVSSPTTERTAETKLGRFSPGGVLEQEIKANWSAIQAELETMKGTGDGAALPGPARRRR